MSAGAVEAHRRRVRGVDIKLTDVCNVDCIMCGQRVRKEGVLVKNFVDAGLLKAFFSGVGPGLSVYLWGGEPLLHPKFTEIVRFFIDKKASVAVNTNGFLLKNHLEFLASVPLGALVLSFDGIGELHDRIRRQKGLFDRAKGSLLSYVATTRHRTRRPKVIVNFTVIPENYRVLETFCDEVKGWDVSSITLNLPILVDRAAGERFSEDSFGKTARRLISWRGYIEDYKGKFDYKEFAAICERVVNRHGNFVRWSNETMPLNAANLALWYESPDVVVPRVKTGPWDGRHAPCAKLTDSICIDATGGVVLCPDFPDTRIGHIRDNTFNDFRSTERYRLFNLFDEASAMCLRCPHRR